MKPRPSMWEDLRGLWSVAWRALLLGPVVVPLGYLALILGVVSLVFPPAYCIVCLYTGDYLLGALAAIGWAVWLRVAPRFLRPMFENWRDDG